LLEIDGPGRGTHQQGMGQLRDTRFRNSLGVRSWH